MTGAPEAPLVCYSISIVAKSADKAELVSSLNKARDRLLQYLDAGPNDGTETLNFGYGCANLLVKAEPAAIYLGDMLGDRAPAAAFKPRTEDPL